MHRGPDWSSVWGDGKGNYIAHQRLSIVAPDTGNSTVEGSSGNQPLFTKDGTLSWIVNGEIYNHTALKARPVRHCCRRFATCCHGRADPCARPAVGQQHPDALQLRLGGCWLPV